MSTTNDKAYKVERDSNEGDTEAGLNIITMLLARGMEPDEVMAALAMAMATFNVIAVPGEKELQENTKNTEEFIRKAQEHMWPFRGQIEEVVRHRVSRVTPLAQMLNAIKRRKGGGDTRSKETEPAEPQHEQFKV